METAILVNEQAHGIGSMDSLDAHRKRVLHGELFIVIFNYRNDVPLQIRSRHKYDSGGLRTNARCNYSTGRESIHEAIRKILIYEIAIKPQPDFAYKFMHRYLTQNELDYIGLLDGISSGCKLMERQSSRNDIGQHPDQDPVWFKLIMNHRELKVS